MKKSIRDSQEYESSQIHYDNYARSLLRNFSAHFFRWSFARRLIQPSDDVLEIGCGVEYPLVEIMLGSSPSPRLNTYHGVDINSLPEHGNSRVSLQGDFNFVERWKELYRGDFFRFSMIVHFEVIEHMLVKNALGLLQGCHKLLQENGRMLMSTPVYDERRHSSRHVHEYTTPEMKDLLSEAGFKVVSRFGTFMDVKYISKSDDAAVVLIFDRLKKYFDNDALSCFFAPMFPDQARNNFWICIKK